MDNNLGVDGISRSNPMQHDHEEMNQCSMARYMGKCQQESQINTQESAKISLFIVEAASQGDFCICGFDGEVPEVGGKVWLQRLLLCDNFLLQKLDQLPVT